MLYCKILRFHGTVFFNGDEIFGRSLARSACQSYLKVLIPKCQEAPRETTHNSLFLCVFLFGRFSWVFLDVVRGVFEDDFGGLN